MLPFLKIRTTKRKMEREFSSNPDKNNRKFARYIKSKRKSRTTIGLLKTEDGRLLTQDAEMAEELNRFFSIVFTKETLINAPTPIREDIGETMRKVRITPTQIKDVIDDLRADAALGPDGISPVLKELREVVAEPLSMIFNRSLREVTVPDDWRTGNVTLIYKKGPKGNPGNYRPVSRVYHAN